MSFFKDDISGVRAFLFDVDGVLSADYSPLDDTGDPLRTANVKDGFAIKLALAEGFEIGIITGGTQSRVKMRYQKLGVRHFYDNIRDKCTALEEFIFATGIDASHILYMGDDLPDLELMEICGIPTCPSDAVTEIKLAAKYISDRNGGEGCVRDVIEQVLRAQEKWNSSPSFKQSSY